MGHTAFEVHSVIENIPIKIESFAAWGNNLLVGTSDGVLLVYSVSYTPLKEAQNTKKLFSATLTNSKKSFAKGAISQLSAIPEIGLLVSLADGCVRLHSLAELSEIAILKNSKGQSLKGRSFALKKHRGVHSIVVIMKKALAVLQYSKLTFKLIHELTLPDTAKSVNWCGDFLCVGFKKEYSLVDPNSVHAPKRLGASQAAVGLSLPTEVFIALNNVGIGLNFEGKPVRKHGVAYSEIPLCLGYTEPFIISAMPSCVEVRILSRKQRKETLVQTIPLTGIVRFSQANFVDYDELCIDHGMGVGYRHTKAISNQNEESDPNNRIFLSTKNSIYVLTVRQFYLQILELQQKRDFELALYLCEIVEGTNYRLEQWRVNSLNLDYAFYLFACADFERAMDYFSKTDEDPRRILALFPELLPSNKPFPFENPFTGDEQGVVEQLLYDLDQRRKALEAFIMFLSSKRVNASKALSHEEQEIAECVDTALMKALVINEYEFVSKFLENPNRCTIIDAEAILMQYKKYNELITFYKSRGLHQRALELLHTLGMLSDSAELYGVGPTISYLSSNEVDEQLVFDYAMWVLKQEPILGLKIFHSRPELNTDKVFEYLERVDQCANNSMVISYLEHLILVEKAKDPNLHNRLILMYLEFIQNEKMRDINERTKAPIFHLEEIQIRLRCFLEESKYYNSEKMLSKFPLDEMFEERAVLLSRINRHEQAISIYVTKLKRLDLAEEYCMKFYDPSPTAHEEARDIFILLLRMLLKPVSPEEPRLDECIDILERHCGEIDPGKALYLLPAITPTKKILRYLQKMIRHHVTKKRHLQVLKNLHKSENLQVQDKYAAAGQRSVRISQNTTCPVCNKKIGVMAFACYPNGKVVHYFCMKNNVNVCPVTGCNFLKDSLMTSTLDLA